MRVEDLPKGVRERVLAQLGEQEAAKPGRAPRAAPEAKSALTCRACGERFPKPTVGQLTKHTAATRHSRYEIDLPSS